MPKVSAEKIENRMNALYWILNIAMFKLMGRMQWLRQDNSVLSCVVLGFRELGRAFGLAYCLAQWLLSTKRMGKCDSYLFFTISSISNKAPIAW